MPAVLGTAKAIRQYGAAAIIGNRVLTVAEVRTMNTALNIADAWAAREASKEWAKWAEANPQAARLLAWAMED